MILLNKWPEMFVAGQEETFSQHHKRILQFFSGIKIEPSKSDGAGHFVHARAEGTLSAEGMLGLLREWID
jgi:hypothetical protein